MFEWFFFFQAHRSTGLQSPQTGHLGHWQRMDCFKENYYIETASQLSVPRVVSGISLSSTCSRNVPKRRLSTCEPGCATDCSGSRTLRVLNYNWTVVHVWREDILIGKYLRKACLVWIHMRKIRCGFEHEYTCNPWWIFCRKIEIFEIFAFVS